MTSNPATVDVPEVAEALATVAGLAERPLDEHHGVLESAHQALRRALDAPTS